jgi:protein-disulfide isomerase
MLNKTYKRVLTLVLLSVLIIVLIGVSIYIIKQKQKDTLNTKVLQSIIIDKDLDITFGNYESDLSIILYFDYNCHYCKKFFLESYNQLNEEFIQSGRVKLILRLMSSTRNLQIENALKSIVCVNKVGNSEYLHELFLHNYSVIFTPDFQQILDEFLEKDIYYAECFLGEEVLGYLQENYKDFKTLKLKGTPTFIIGKEIYRGYRDYETFRQIIIDHF